MERNDHDISEQQQGLVDLMVEIANCRRSDPIGTQEAAEVITALKVLVRRIFEISGEVIRGAADWTAEDRAQYIDATLLRVYQAIARLNRESALDVDFAQWLQVMSEGAAGYLDYSDGRTLKV